MKRPVVRRARKRDPETVSSRGPERSITSVDHVAESHLWAEAADVAPPKLGETALHLSQSPNSRRRR